MRWNPGAVFAPSAILGAIIGVVVAVITFFANRGLASGGLGSQLNTALQAGSISSGAGVIIQVILGSVLTGIVAAAIGRGLLGGKDTLSSAWRAARPRVWALIGAALAGSVGVIIAWAVLLFVAVVAGTAIAASAPTAAGVLAGIVIGLAATVFAVIVWVRWSLALPVVVLERTGPLRALGRSWRLARRSAWRLFWMFVVTSLVVGIVDALIRLPFGVGGEFLGHAIGGSGESSAAQIISAVISAIGVIAGSAVTAPVMSCVTVLLYADLRMRREGMDLAVLAGLGPAGEYPPPPGFPVPVVPPGGYRPPGGYPGPAVGYPGPAGGPPGAPGPVTPGPSPEAW
jgi:hypothetical protein